MNPEELLRLLQQIQASQQTQVQAVPSQPPQRSIMDILGGDTTPEGSSIFAYGGPGAGFSMPESNQRIQMILEALQAGEAPGAADPLLGEQVRQDFTPINPQPGQTFALKGFQDEGFGFDPRTGAFTNINVPTSGKTTPKPAGINPKAMTRHSEIVKALTQKPYNYPPSQAVELANQAVPEIAELMKASKQKERVQAKEDTAEIQRRNLREKFVMENQSNLFKRETGESFLGEGKPPENTEQILKDYAVLKPENAKDMRSLDMVGGYVDGFRRLLTSLKPLLASTKTGITGRLGAAANVEYLRKQGNPTIREMDALIAQITLLARGFGGDARVSDKEMERLDKAVIDGWTTKEGADTTLKVLDSFIKNRGTSLGFSKYKTIEQRVMQQNTKQPAKASSKLPAGAVDIHRTHQGKPVYRLPDGTLYVED